MVHSAFYLFASEAAHHLVAFVMGSAIMAAISFIERAIKPLPTFVYVAAIVLGGTVFATYGAWQDEHTARLAAENSATILQNELV